MQTVQASASFRTATSSAVAATGSQEPDAVNNVDFATTLEQQITQVLTPATPDLPQATQESISADVLATASSSVIEMLPLAWQNLIACLPVPTGTLVTDTTALLAKSERSAGRSDIATAYAAGLANDTRLPPDILSNMPQRLLLASAAMTTTQAQSSVEAFSEIQNSLPQLAPAESALVAPTALPAIAAGAVHQAAAAEQAAKPALYLAPRVGSNAWDQALAQKVVWVATTDSQTASLSLNPPELGPLHIVLSLSDTQAVATFSSAQPEVRQAIEAAMPKLRELLGEAGLQLSDASVNSGNPGQQGETSRGRNNTANVSQDEPSGMELSAPAILGSGRGMVDTFA